MMILQRNIMTADQQASHLMKGMFDTSLLRPQHPQQATGIGGRKVIGGKKKKNIQDLVGSLLQSPSPPPPFPFPPAAAAAANNTAAGAAAAAGVATDLYSNVPFPLRLHAMLDDSTQLGFDHIVSWECDGRAFKVHNINEFTTQILSKYFNQTRYKSFQRQLNMYGFRRVSRGNDKGTCFHKFFVRGQSQLCIGMQRIKVKDTITTNTDTTGGDPQQVLSSSSKSPPLLTSSADNSTQEPAHHHDDVAVDSSSSSSSSTSASLSSDDSSKAEEEEKEGGGGTTTFDIAFFEGKSFFLVEEKTLQQDQQQQDQQQQQKVIFDNLPTPNDILHKKKKMKDPSSTITMEQLSQQLQVESSQRIVRPQKNCRNDSFPWKLYDLLEYASQHGHDDIVSWEDDGKAMKVYKPKELCTTILPHFFLHTKKWESFQRQLNLYGFTRIARNPHKGRYVHPNFIRGQRSLCRHITRPR